MKITKPKITPGPWDLFNLGAAIKAENAKPGADGTAFRISAERTLCCELRACGDGFVYGENEANAQAIACVPEMLSTMENIFQKGFCTVDDFIQCKNVLLKAGYIIEE